ncbi:unnamed protein product [Bursaphelenchus okinawaensis]|uniref:BPTI/Kunitz inhibitor domain-containing protein n=1 Tax=Bursaphelenchus okinawaensis TaxID=465554 RepID=A0A811L972_9BILA|nr:unnamed protein product [Bursaphelenchus okinawaensis]CAG9118448.1 unnamed protein product [Bursaphelenchus okinawaensis]
MRSGFIAAVLAGLAAAQITTICSDQKTLPLLEGKGDIYACDTDCPDGFACEKEEGDEVGVCCPNLKELSELYGDQNETAKVDFQKAAVHKNVEEKDKKEIRRSPGRAQRVPLPLAPQPSPLPLSSSSLLSQPTTSTPSDQPQKPTGIICERQKFKTTCESNGFIKSTQFVLRWYVQNGKCHSYPFGFCPGTRVDHDRTMRTKDDCELLCLTPEEFRHSDLFDFLATAEGAITQQPEFEALDELPSNEAAVELETATQILEEQKAEKTLEKFKNPDACVQFLPFKAMCHKTMRPSHFTVRWVVLNGKCESYPYGYCPEEYDPEVLILSTKEQCEAFCSHELKP